MTMPAIAAFLEGPAANPKTQGETNRNAPRIRFATSHNFALVHFSMMSMTASISNQQRLPCTTNRTAAVRVPGGPENLMKPWRSAAVSYLGAGVEGCSRAEEVAAFH